jgi:Mce-associated membrane protein
VNTSQSGGAAGTPDKPEMGSDAMHVDADRSFDRDEAGITVESDVETEGQEPQCITDSADFPSDSETDLHGDSVAPATRRPNIAWSRVVAFGVLPGLGLSLAAVVGALKWQEQSYRGADVSSIEAVAAAKDSTVALLSYQADSVEKDLDAVRDRLTGAFKDSYTQLVRDVVIPGAKQQHISSVATVPASSSVSATWNHAVTLLYVDQRVTVGNDPPTDSTSSVRVTLDKVAGRWLISGFDPV